MAIKNQAKRKAGVSNEIGKRFNKARLKRDMVADNVKTEREVKKVGVAEKPKREYKAIQERYEFKGTPKNVTSGTLRHPSTQAKGYDVLSKGQQVTIEDFGGDQPLRITTMDGRVGITDWANIKPLFV